MLPLSTITQSFCGEKIELESLDENKPIEIDSVCCWNKLVERGLGGWKDDKSQSKYM